MKTTPRTGFEKPLVTTHDERCVRCNSLKLHRDEWPPSGATWNPPTAIPSKQELEAMRRPKPRYFMCLECHWAWFPDHPEYRGQYVSKRGRANHDPGDEDRR